MIDSYSPLDYRPVLHDENQQIDEAQIVLGFACNLWSISAKELSNNINIEEILNLDTENQLKYILHKSKENSIIFGEIELEQIRNLYQVFQANVQAKNSYHPQSYPGKITFFSASKLVEGANQETSLSWAKLAPNGIDIHKIDGDHFSIIKNPILVDKLREYLV